MRVQWSNLDLQQAIGALNCGYTVVEVYEAFSIPRTSLKDYYNIKVKKGKMGPKTTLTKEEKLLECMVEMKGLIHSLNANDLKLKVEEICQ